MFSNLKINQFLSLAIVQATAVFGLSAAQPNIVFILSDDHAYQSIGSYDSPFKDFNPTPEIDNLAEEGTLFTNSFVTNSICAPSRAAILTGKYSHMNGVRAWETFDGSQTTFPQLLQEAGYHTVLVGKWHLKSDPTGFDEWLILPGQGVYEDPTFYNDTNYKRPNELQTKGYCSDVITRMAEEHIKNRPADKPLALFVHHKAAHTPFQWDPRDADWLENDTIPEPSTLRDTWEGRPGIAQAHNKVPNIEQLHAFLAQGLKGKDRRGKGNPADRKLSPQERATARYQFYIKAYLRCAKSIDRSVGEINQLLKDEKIDDNTVLIYMADQGFYLGEHGMSDKRWAYEQSFRTPLIIKFPKAKSGQRVDQFALNIDLAPTLLELAGVEIPADIQGSSLVPLLNGEQPSSWRERIYYRYYDDKGYRIPQHQAVRTDRYKLIYFPKEQRYELFDLEKDPTEMHNLAENPEYSALMDKMKVNLKEVREELKEEDQDVYPSTRETGKKNQH
ncbi:sulfatase family protein [Persicirhabdus sediminis]|uniref:Sulfatase n=1 Tax=Persicirhabdus sediminis TaxID=454144 RepID=A0A8J7MEU1_9BACT|nr:sulfatase [Persicirhabdus sediminis]MBK1791203.1 sulfatase [Persicirhabdus sediminis]